MSTLDVAVELCLLMPVRIRGDTPFQVASSSTKVFYISLTTSVLGGYKIRITTLDPVTGKPTSQFSLGADSDLASISDIIFVGSNTASPILAWTDKAKKTLKVNVIGVKPVTTIAIDNKSGEPIEDVKVVAPRHTPSQPHFLIHYRTKSFGWAVVYHTDLTTNNVSKSHRIPVVKENDVFAVSNLDANVYFTRVTEKEVSLTSSRSADVLGKWPRTDEQVSEPGSHLIAEVVAKPDKTYAVRYAQTLESGDWELGQNGVQVWLRPESVAGAVLAEWAEPQVEEALARELDVEGHQNVLAAYIHRVKRHARDIQLYFPGWIQALPFRIMSSFVATEATSVDAFGFGKTVILATEKGRLIALDTGKMGKIVWNVRIGSEHWEPKAIFVQGAIVTVYAADGSFVKVAVANGAVVEEGSLGQKVKTLAQIPGATETLTLAVSEDGTVQPFSGSVLPNTLLVTLSEDSKAVGWKLDSETPIPLWTFKPAAGQKLVSATARPAHDPISSIGKVLGDRSVLYKYINPNLAFLTATSEAENTVTFYLLDSISGQVLYTASHRDVDTKQPITSTMSENWFAYSFFSTAGSSSSAQGNQLIIAEMYESSLANDRGSLDSAQNYSSLYSPEPNAPHVISQSYIIPEPISSLSTSQTRQGITTKYLLATLPNSNALVGIPRGVLNPRRTLDRDPTPAEAEEGLFRYAPFLDFDGRWYLSHGREVMGINKVTSVMTGLESTGLVLAFGNDIFGTRVAPSGGFDYLGKGFNKVQLVLTVVGLAIGVTMLAPMVSRCFVAVIVRRIEANEECAFRYGENRSTRDGRSLLRWLGRSVICRYENRDESLIQRKRINAAIDQFVSKPSSKSIRLSHVSDSELYHDNTTNECMYVETSRGLTAICILYAVHQVNICIVQYTMFTVTWCRPDSNWFQGPNSASNLE